MYRACIFDLDGTLANTLYSIADFSNRALKACGYPAIAPEDYRRIVGDGADTQMRRMLTRVRGTYTEEELSRLRAVYDGYYAADPTHLIEPYGGMDDTLHRLHAQGIKLAVLSNKPHAWTAAIMQSLFGDGLFNRCYGQQPGIPKKPAPDGALRIAKELDVPPAACLYVGDTNTDMKTGAAAGMDTAGAAWGFRGRQELEENHAVYIVEKPTDLLPLIARAE